MDDTFKGIITADGKKRQLRYANVLEAPVSDKTLSEDGGFADAKVTGDNFAKAKAETDSLKSDLFNLEDRYTTVINSKNILNRELIQYGKLIDALGNIVDNADTSACVWYGKVKPNTRYYFCRKNSQGNYIALQARVAQYRENGTVISETVTGATGTATYDVTTTSETAYIGKYNGAVTWDETVSAPMIIEDWDGVVPTEYEPFSSDTKLKQEYYKEPKQYSKWYGCNAVFLWR